MGAPPKKANCKKWCKFIHEKRLYTSQWLSLMQEKIKTFTVGIFEKRFWSKVKSKLRCTIKVSMSICLMLQLMLI